VITRRKISRSQACTERPEAYRWLYIRWCHHASCSSPREPPWSSDRADRCRFSSLITTQQHIQCTKLMFIVLSATCRTWHSKNHIT